MVLTCGIDLEVLLVDSWFGNNAAHSFDNNFMQPQTRLQEATMDKRNIIQHPPTTLEDMVGLSNNLRLRCEACLTNDMPQGSRPSSVPQNIHDIITVSLSKGVTHTTQTEVLKIQTLQLCKLISNS